MLLLKVPEAVVVLNNLTETASKFYSTTIFQDFGISNFVGNESVPDSSQLNFLDAFQMFDDAHLTSNVENPVVRVLDVFTNPMYGFFLFKSWSPELRALHVRMLQKITVAHPDCLGDFAEAHSTSALSALNLLTTAILGVGEQNITRQIERVDLLVSFAISSLAGLSQINNRLMKDVDYPVQPPLPALPEIFLTRFLQISCDVLVQQILDIPPLNGAEVGQWILTPLLELASSDTS